MKKNPTMWPYDPRLQELIVAFLKMAKITKKPYAIGGALAMGAQGYVRHTSDLDTFLRHEDSPVWMRAAKAVGLTVDHVFGSIHFIAFNPKHGDPRIRIDMLFPAAEPDLTAIEHPVKASIGGIQANVYQIELLALSKFLSDRDEDQRDFSTLFKLGLFDPEYARQILASFDKSELRAFDRRIKALSVPVQVSPIRVGRRGKR